MFPLFHDNRSLLPFRSKGIILNISSATGMCPSPLLTLYSATKVSVPFHTEIKCQTLSNTYRNKCFGVHLVVLS